MSNNTIKAEGLGDLFKIFGRISAKAGEKTATTVKKIQAELWKLLQTLLPQPQLKPKSSFIIITRSNQFLSPGQRSLPRQICVTFGI